MTKQEILDSLRETAESANTILSRIDGDDGVLARLLIASVLGGLAHEINRMEPDEPGDDECCGDCECPNATTRAAMRYAEAGQVTCNAAVDECCVDPECCEVEGCQVSLGQYIIAIPPGATFTLTLPKA